MRDLAPVILFVYNRPWHTRQTLEALKLNELAKDSRLIIFSDGFTENANKQEINKVKEVRSLIREEKWCGEVKIIERPENLGLAASVILGVTEVIEEHGRVIVLEDDIVTGKYFLKFMNEALNIYESEKRVYGVSGYQFTPSKEIKESTYFLPIMSSWGYATWADRWSQINFNGEELLEIVKNKKIGDKLNFGSINYLKMLKDQVDNLNNSWAVRFYVSMYLKNGLFLYPNKSLLRNIGFDGTGIHSGLSASSHYKVKGNFNTEIKIIKSRVRLIDAIVINSRLGSFGISRIKQNKIKGILKGVLPFGLIQFYQHKMKNRDKAKEKKQQIPRYTNTTINLDGKEIMIPDITSYKFMHEEIFKHEIYKFYTSNKEPFIIDGGANIGLATIYLKQIYPYSNIVAFEPDPKIFQLLKNNITQFGLDRVELIEKGIWNKTGISEFCSEGADGGLISNLDKTQYASNKIKVTSLRPYLKQQVDFLKLDIEGAETVVLRDIQYELKNVKRIFVEYHSFVNQNQTLSEIIEILTKADFRLYIDSPGLSSRSPFVKLNTYNNMDMQLNIYGFKE